MESMYSNFIDNSTNMNRGTHTFEVTKLTIGGTRPNGYQDMVQRAFLSNVKHDDLNHVVDEVLRNGKLTNSSTTASNMVTVSSTPLGLSAIRGGWKEYRYFFKLEVRCRPRDDIFVSGASTTYDLVLTGYSEPSSDFIKTDVLGNFTYDPNLLFTINNIQRVGLNEHTKNIVGIDNIGVTDPLAYRDNSNDICIRPLDVISSISNKYSDNFNGIQTMRIDVTTDNMPVSFDRTHMVGKNYVTDLVNSTVEGVANNDGVRQAFNTLYDTKHTAAYAEATSILENKSNITYDDVFLTALSRINGTNGNVFSIRDLHTIDPNIDKKIMFIDVKETNRFQSDQMLSTAYTESLTGASVINGKVTELHNALVSLLTSQFLSHLEINIFNQPQMGPTGALVLKPIWNIPPGPSSVAWTYNINNNQQQLMALLKNKIDGMVNMIIDPLLSSNGNVEYSVVISADMTSDTTILISFNGQQPIPYRFPTFADMCFNPMVGNTEARNNLVGNLGMVSDTVIDNIVGSNISTADDLFNNNPFRTF